VVVGPAEEVEAQGPDGVPVMQYAGVVYDIVAFSYRFLDTV
jgi:hypothetical protein